MLVLSRRPGASVIIDHSLKVTVEVVGEDDVCLSIEGPAGTEVERIEEREMADALAARGRSWDPARLHVLSRRSRPSVLVDGKIRIVVLSINNDVVRVGFDAPANIEVHREEVYRQIQDANRSAVSAPEQDLVGLAGLVRSRARETPAGGV